MGHPLSALVLFSIFEWAQSALPPPPLKVSSTTDPKWIQSSLERHNYLRALHGSPPLILNQTLCEISQSWANYLLAVSLSRIRTKEEARDKGNYYFEHNYAVNRKYNLGENLFYGSHPRGELINATLPLTLWYKEIQDYDFTFARVKGTSDPNSMIGMMGICGGIISSECYIPGHFTQIVWRWTEEMGTAAATAPLPNGLLVTFVVANYYPGGNVRLLSDFPEIYYIQNVLPPIGTGENKVTDLEQIIKDKVVVWDLARSHVVSTPKDWIEGAVEKLNEFRSYSNFLPLIYSPELEAVSQSWADHLLQKGLKEFNSPTASIDGRRGFTNYGATEKAGFGESVMYFLTGGVDDPQSPPIHPHTAPSLWYSQHRWWYAHQQDYFHNSTHPTTPNKAKDFLQMIWKSTSHVGIAFACGEADNGQLLTFVVANYYPRAPPPTFNWEELQENVPTQSAGLSQHSTLPLFFYMLFHSLNID